MRIVWYAKAVDDHAIAVAYIRERNPEAAARVALRLIGCVEHLATFPRAGRLSRIRNIREIVLVEFPYVVRYRVKDDTVQILRIFHTSMRGSN